MNRASFIPSVLIVATHVRRLEPCNDSRPPRKEPGSGFGSGPKSGLAFRAVCDPFEVQRLFPDLWRAYLRAHFRGVSHIVAVFDVSERTARKWLSGEVDPAGHYVAVACRVHPDTAPQMLFAAE